MVNAHPSYIAYCNSKAFLAWSCKHTTFPLRRRQTRLSKLKLKLEVESGACIGAGDTTRFLRNIKDGAPLGAGQILLKEELCVQHDDPDEEWVEAYREYSLHTKYGVLILAETMEEYWLWIKTPSYREQLKKIPYGRLFVYVEHTSEDEGGKRPRGFILCIDPGGEYGSATVENGLGYVLFGNGTNYHGGLKDGIRHGKGKFVWASGDVYEGEWSLGKMHGVGKYTWQKSGAIYEGEWVYGEKHGVGKKMYSYRLLNRVQDGLWKNDSFEREVYKLQQYKM
jgi:hypothetical protein